MAVTWLKTKFLGVRYREHKTRKHGGNRPDKCFSIRYKINGHDKEEVVGWSSQGVSAESASKMLAQLRENARLGTGPLTLAELRTANAERDLRERQAEEQKQAEKITFADFWKSDYFPNAEMTKKPGTIESEKWLYRKWIAPEIGNIPLQQLTIKHIEPLVNKAKKAHKSPATLRYIIAVISQVWAKADVMGIVSGECPCRKIKKPRQDNRRTRFLTPNEASRLLADLKIHSQDMHDIALLALYTGLRAGEIHGLVWGNVDLEQNTIEVLDTKNKKNRHIHMTAEVKNMFLSRKNEQPKTALIFPDRNGKKRRWVSDTFERSVNRLGLNNSGDFKIDEGGNPVPVLISDARQKVVFHTLRHTFASWLVQKGEPLYNVAELLGHSTVDMTRRYSHLAPDSLKSAVLSLEGILADS